MDATYFQGSIMKFPRKFPVICSEGKLRGKINQTEVWKHSLGVQKNYLLIINQVKNTVAQTDD